MINFLSIEGPNDQITKLQSILKKTWTDSTFISVPNQEALVLSAKDHKPDIIFLSLNASEENGIDICHQLKEDSSIFHIPVVFLYSNDEDENFRIKALEEGADAFLSTPIDEVNLIAQVKLLLRLNSSKKPVTETHLLLKKAEQEIESLKKTEIKLRNIFDSMSEGFSIQDVIVDEDGNPIDLRFIEANPAFEKQTGLINDQTLGHTLLELFPTSEDYWIKRYGKVGITGEPISFEAMFGPLDIFYHVNAFQTAPNQFGVLFTDINEKKLHEIELTKAKERAEESERNLIRGQKIAKMGFWKLDVETNRVTGTDELLKIFELEKGDLTVETFMQVVHPEDREMDLIHINNGIENGIPWEIEHRLLFPDGRVKWITAAGQPEKNDKNEVTTIVGIVQDITESKNNILALKESEEFSKAIINNSLNAIMVADDLGNYISVNEAAALMFGYSREKMLQMNADEINTKTLKNATKKHQIYLKKGHEIGEFEFINSNGEARIAQYHAVRIRENFNLSILTDISEQKRSEELILKNKNRLDFSLRSIETGAWELDLDKHDSWRSLKHDQIFGYEEALEEWTYENFLAHVVPEHQEEVHQKFQHAIETKTDWDFECQIRQANGNIRWIWARGKQEFDTAHPKGKMFGIVQDINDRKLIEKELIQSEEKFKSLMQQSPFVVEIYDINGLQTAVNRAYEELWGFPAKTTVNKFNVLESKEIHQSGLLEYIKKAYAGETVNVPEYKFDPRGDTEADGEGRVRWLNTKVYPIKDKMELVTNIVIVHQDISDRKKSELELSESIVREKLMADIVRQSSVGITIGYPDGRLGMSNSAFQTITGYSEKELQDIYWNDVLTPPEWEELESLKLQELHTNKIPVKYEKEYIKKDGSRVPIELIVHPRFDKNGEVEHYFGFITDITDRKLAETELSNNQKYLAAVFNNTQDAQLLSKYLGNKEFEIVAVNDSYLRKLQDFGLNVTEKDLIGKSIKQLIFNKLGLSQEVYDYTIGFYYEVIKKSTQTHHNENFTINNEIYYSETSYSPIVNSENITTYVLYNSHDITKEKESIALLKTNEIRYKTLFNDSPIPLWEEDFSELVDYFSSLKEKGITDLNKYFAEFPNELYACAKMVKIIDVNKATLTLHKADDKEQLIGNLDKTFTENSFFAFKKELIAVFDGKNYFEAEAEVKTLDGELKNIHIVLKIDQSQEEKGRALLATTDITERKTAEIQLKESESNLTALINNTDDSIWSLDREYKYLIFNNTYSDIFLKSYGLDLKKGIDAKKQLSEVEYQFWIPQFDAALSGEKRVFEFSHEFDGAKYHFQTLLNPIYEDNIITGVSARSVNISARKDSEEKITKQLNELRRWHDAMINREEKTLELKNEVNKLLKKLGQPIKYTSVSEEHSED